MLSESTSSDMFRASGTDAGDSRESGRLGDGGDNEAVVDVDVDIGIRVGVKVGDGIEAEVGFEVEVEVEVEGLVPRYSSSRPSACS